MGFEVGHEKFGQRFLRVVREGEGVFVDFIDCERPINVSCAIIRTNAAYHCTRVNSAHPGAGSPIKRATENKNFARTLGGY